MAIERVTASVGENSGELENKKTEIYEGELEAPEKRGEYRAVIKVYDYAGNVSINQDSKVEVSIWRSPKTDWKAEDRFNLEDYNRIKNNLVYLHEFAVSMWHPFEILDMGADMKEYTGFWDVDIFNMFEKNVDIINSNILPQNFGVSQIFFENGPFIKWDELNRIEGAILSISEILSRQKEGLRRIPFRLGNMKEVRI